MSPEALLSQRVYADLRNVILSGRFKPGVTLVAHSLGAEFGVSLSPMRDVMQRLVGERLLEALPGGGFGIPVLDQETLYDLYMWHWQVVRLAVKARPEQQSAPELDRAIARLRDDEGAEIARVTSLFFHHLAENSQNREYLHAITIAGDRLNATRMAETHIRHRARELKSLWSLIRSGRESAFQNAIWVYHRRRLRPLSP